MNWLERLHGRFHQTHRLQVLGRHLLTRIPSGTRVLDVGCGDGLLTRWVADHGEGLQVEGADVLLRPDAHVPVTLFDGHSLPWPDAAFDVVVLVDVLHHCNDPDQMLGEAARVAGRCLVLKDHLLQGPLATQTLRFMDRTSNLKHGVDVPCNYWTPEQWRRSCARHRLHVEACETRLGLYPGPLRPIFERSLHFVARFRVERD